MCLPDHIIQHVEIHANSYSLNQIFYSIMGKTVTKRTITTFEEIFQQESTHKTQDSSTFLEFLHKFHFITHARGTTELLTAVHPRKRTQKIKYYIQVNLHFCTPKLC